MTIKRLSLTTFFIALTLSIGLVSVNVPLSVTAQDNALSQSGNSESEQETKQSQSSNQNGQVVSGDLSVLSGNNLACQDQENSEADLGLCSDGAVLPGPGIGLLKIKTVLRANCASVEPTACPRPDGAVQIFVNGQPYRQYEANSHIREGTTERTIAIPSGPYSIHAIGAPRTHEWEYELGNIQGDCSGRDTCNAIMTNSGANVVVNFHYCRGHC
ncbi:MAG TPA: hypothetical protein VJP58_03490 [Candidatus Nitrosocosmicus sp.]|nr:hypothetical protein [Candidatus Nitrosocosmicus sp.]